MDRRQSRRFDHLCKSQVGITEGDILADRGAKKLHLAVFTDADQRLFTRDPESSPRHGQAPRGLPRLLIFPYEAQRPFLARCLLLTVRLLPISSWHPRPSYQR